MESKVTVIPPVPVDELRAFYGLRNTQHIRNETDRQKAADLLNRHPSDPDGGPN